MSLLGTVWRVLAEKIGAAASTPTTATLLEVPPRGVASETLARLYEAQGYPAKADRVRELLRTQSVPLCELTAEQATLHVRWNLGPNRRLTVGARPTLRIALLRPGKAQELRDLAVQDVSGQTSMVRPAGAVARASLGILQADGSFTSIVHSETC